MHLSHILSHSASVESTITIGSLSLLAQRIGSADSVVAIVDSNVAGVCGRIGGLTSVVEIECGERCKSIEEAARLWQKLIELGADRNTLLVAIGGGTLTDLVGFVASTFMRGVESVLVPTTLLAQVDAAVGGKCGINVGGYKNMVGTFNLPSEVVCDVDLLSTLPLRAWRCGMAEVIKSAIIGDAQLFELLESSSVDRLRCDAELCREVVARAVAVKCAIVGADFRESGVRRVLNLGHTIGHAIESLGRDYSHGEAVAIGIAEVAKMAVEKGLLGVDDCNRIIALLERYELPISSPFSAERLHEAMLHDKKNRNGQICWVLPTGIGTMPK